MKLSLKHFVASIAILLGMAIIICVQIQSEGSKSLNTPVERGGPRMCRGDFALYNVELEFRKMRDPQTDAIPSAIRAKELKYVSSLPEAEQFTRGQDWNHRGPFNVGGRMLCMAFDVENEQHMLAGSASGGMFQTYNGGLFWQKVTSADDEQSATCIAQDTRPGKTDTWYYGTGELLSTTDRNVSTKVRTIGIGNGIFKSTDNGNAWEPLPYTLTAESGQLESVFQGTWSIVADPVTTDKDIVYAACYGAIMRSEDGGETWEITLGDLENKSFCTDIDITADGTLYAVLSTYTFSNMRPSKSGVWRSEDGVNWTNITPEDFPVDTRVMKLAIAPSNQKVFYLMTEYPSTVLEPYNGVFNSVNTFWKYTKGEDGQEGTWEDRTEFMYGHGDGNYTDYPNSLITYGGYCFALAVKTDDENVVVMGGLSAYRSNNGFADSLATTWLGGDPYDMDSVHMLHPDQHAFAFLPSDPNVFYAACDGGIQRTDNVMADDIYWNRRNFGLFSSQFYTVSVDVKGEGDDFILGGLQDNCWYYSPTDNPAEWWFSVDLYYDGFSCKLADHHDYAVVSAYSGNLWTARFDENLHTKDIFYQTPDTLLILYDPLIGSNKAFPFYCNFVLDPNNNATLYLPTLHSIWRKADMAAASQDTSLRNAGWENLSNVDLNESVEITALAISTSPANRLYYGTDNSHVYLLNNAISGNPVPVDITSPEFPVNAYTACIDVNPANADEIFAVFSNYRVRSIFYSDDGGLTWSHQGGNLEEYPDGSGNGPSVRWIKTLDNNGNPVYFAGTSTGLFSATSLNGDSTIWIKEGAANIGNIMVDMIDCRESDRFVAVATHGNGIYSVYYNPAAGTKEEGMGEPSLRSYPNPFTEKVILEYELLQPALVSIIISDISGKTVAYQRVGKQNAGTRQVCIETGTLPAGTYLLQVQINDKRISRKLSKL